MLNSHSHSHCSLRAQEGEGRGRAQPRPPGGNDRRLALDGACELVEFFHSPSHPPQTYVKCMMLHNICVSIARWTVKLIEPDHNPMYNFAYHEFEQFSWESPLGQDDLYHRRLNCTPLSSHAMLSLCFMHYLTVICELVYVIVWIVEKRMLIKAGPILSNDFFSTPTCVRR
jgi:hypothetical protein